ncbi:hypothetical protein [Salinibaculum salinum]|uniref:hypothetical protein n=1 Tax=Salinibaculum salinum TaxID=3131996 RepID=UPI0030EBE0F9
MAVDLSNAFDQLAEPDYWTDVVLVFAGFMGAMIARAAVENMAGQNLPNEVYGVGVGALGLSMGQYEVALGGAVHAVDNLAGTLGIKQSVVGMAGGGA